MENETLTGPDGRIWTRTSPTTLVCQDGTTVLGNPEMTSEYMLSVAYLQPEQN